MTAKFSILSALSSFGLLASASAVTIGFGTALPVPVQDTQSNGTNNQMRQNINTTDTVVLGAGTYQAVSWSYLAAPDSATAGVTQPVFPFLTILNGVGNHTVVAFGLTIDTDPGANAGVLFGGVNNTFTIGAAGATIAAGVQNPSGDGIQNSIMTDTSFGITDHANSLNFDDAGSAGATLDTFGHANLPRTYGFSIEVVAVPEPSTSLLALMAVAGFGGIRRRR
jgi:hypothetical protein